MENTEIISMVRINLINNHDVVKALVSCKLAGFMYLTGMRVMEGKHGLFVSMPSRKDQNGEYRDIYFPESKVARDQLSDTILKEYKKTAGIE